MKEDHLSVHQDSIGFVNKQISLSNQGTIAIAALIIEALAKFKGDFCKKNQTMEAGDLFAARANVMVHTSVNAEQINRC